MRDSERPRRRAMLLVALAAIPSLALIRPSRADLTPAQALGLGLTVDTTFDWPHPSGGKTEIRVEFLGETANTWSYRVSEVAGSKDLSHWVLVLDCKPDGKFLYEHVDSGSPGAGFQLGTDGSTGFSGVKWNTGAGFTSGIFSFTMDDAYAPVNTTVIGKGGGDDYGSSLIVGPDCELAVTVVPAPGAALLGAIGLVAVSRIKRRLA